MGALGILSPLGIMILAVAKSGAPNPVLGQLLAAAYVNRGHVFARDRSHMSQQMAWHHLALGLLEKVRSRRSLMVD